MRLAFVLQANGDGRLPAIERRRRELLPLGQLQRLLQVVGEMTFYPLRLSWCSFYNVAPAHALREPGFWREGPSCRAASSARRLRRWPCAPVAAQVAGWTEEKTMRKWDGELWIWETCENLNTLREWLTCIVLGRSPGLPSCDWAIVKDRRILL